jgi:hypothetical protein
MNNEQKAVSSVTVGKIEAMFYRNNRTETGRNIIIEPEQAELLVKLSAAADKGMPELIEAAYSNYHDERLIAYGFTDNPEEDKQYTTDCEEYLVMITADNFEPIDNKTNCTNLRQQLEKQLKDILDSDNKLFDEFNLVVTINNGFSYPISLGSADCYSGFDLWLQQTIDELNS